MKLKDKLEKEFLLVLGTLLPSEKTSEFTLHLSPIRIIQTEKSAYLGRNLLKEVVITGRSKDKILFKRFAYECNNSERIHSETTHTINFRQVLPYTSELEQIDVIFNEKTISSIKRDRPVRLSINSKANENGVTLDIDGIYDFLKIVARDLKTDECHYLYSDESRDQTIKKPLYISWNRFPFTEKVIIEGLATRGLEVAKYKSESINIVPQPPIIQIYCNEFRILREKNSNSLKEKGDANPPKYEFAFIANGTIHGKSIPYNSFLWDIKNKQYRGNRANILHEGDEKLRVKLSVIDREKEIISKRKRFNPVKMRKFLVEK